MCACIFIKVGWAFEFRCTQKRKGARQPLSRTRNKVTKLRKIQVFCSESYFLLRLCVPRPKHAPASSYFVCAKATFIQTQRAVSASLHLLFLLSDVYLCVPGRTQTHTHRNMSRDPLGCAPNFYIKYATPATLSGKYILRLNNSAPGVHDNFSQKSGRVVVNTAHRSHT